MFASPIERDERRGTFWTATRQTDSRPFLATPIEDQTDTFDLHDLTTQGEAYVSQSES
jgi:hypothetical protein